jgi:putative ABC transport system substrate-binding protein
LDNAQAHQVDAVVVGIDALTQAHREFIAAQLLQRRLPSVARENQFVDAGGLLSYGTHYAESYRHAADYVDKILRGARPVDLPIQQPTRLEFVINLRTASRLGLSISPAVMLRADRLIQ